jgi:flavin reductase (DIM6/NTAB) family NADH-FMN oxidoreductase RutF
MRQEELGDHIMFIGEVVEISADENIESLIYHNGRYRRLGEYAVKPSAEVLSTIEELAEKYKR